MENWFIIIKFKDEVCGLERVELKVYVRFEDILVVMNIKLVLKICFKFLRLICF